MSSKIDKLPVVQFVRTLGTDGQSPEDVGKEITQVYADGYRLFSATPYSRVTINQVEYPVVLYVFVLAE